MKASERWNYLFKTIGLELGEAGTETKSLGSWSGVPSSISHGLAFPRTGAAWGCLRMGKSKTWPSLPAENTESCFLICLFLRAPIACTMIVCVSTQTRAGCWFLGRVSWPHGSAGPLGSSRGSRLWAVRSHDSQSAGVCGANLWPGPREKSHLRNWVIFAITEGSDKCIPGVSTIF